MTHEHAIIFDLDGTLADTAPDLLASLNHSVRNQGFPVFTLDEIGHLVGHGSVAMIKKAFELHETPLEADLLKQLHQKFLGHYEENIAVHSRLYPGVLELLDILRKEGHPLCICTNKYEGMARRLLTELGVLDHFAAVTGGDSFEFRKPDGRHLHGTLELAGKSKGIMIGDTVTDAGAAKNAGLPLILVDFGYSDTPVTEFEPDSIISHFDQCHNAIKNILGSM